MQLPRIPLALLPLAYAIPASNRCNELEQICLIVDLRGIQIINHRWALLLDIEGNLNISIEPMSTLLFLKITWRYRTCEFRYRARGLVYLCNNVRLLSCILQRIWDLLGSNNHQNKSRNSDNDCKTDPRVTTRSTAWRAAMGVSKTL